MSQWEVEALREALSDDNASNVERLLNAVIDRRLERLFVECRAIGTGASEGAIMERALERIKDK